MSDTPTTESISDFSHWFHSGGELKLQRLDAGVMEGILMRLMKLGVVALPVHDSLVCDLDFAQDVDQIMREKFIKAFFKTLELRTILRSSSTQDLVGMVSAWNQST